jgi:peptide/nickel transport system permease protein
MIVSLLVFFAVSAPWITPYEYDEIDIRGLFKPPSSTHLFGTDDLGHDVFTRTIYAGRVSLSVAVIATLFSATIGTIVGLFAGFHGRALDGLLMRITDIFISIPAIAIMFVLAKSLGPGLRSIIVVLCAFGWMATARLVRGEVLRIKSREFIEAARAAGASELRILFRHVFSNVLSPMTVAASLFVGQAILAETTISYFGLGIQPPTPSWGNMLQNAQEFLPTAPWLALFPGFFIFVTVLAFNFLGDGIRDALDPRLKV